MWSIGNLVRCYKHRTMASLRDGKNNKGGRNVLQSCHLITSKYHSNQIESIIKHISSKIVL